MPHPPTTDRRGPLPGIPGSLFSLLYSLAIHRRNRRFDAGRGVVTFDRPVISVGNLSVGGTGKTPMVHFLVRTLLDAGHHPCIAMRGYASRDGASDEAETYRRAFPPPHEVPVVAQPDRIRGLLRLFHDQYESTNKEAGEEAGEEGGGTQSDCILLDDGFQHRRIARQMDIVLIDATRPPFKDKLLPAGWLREPISSLRRATHTIITHAESVSPAELAQLERDLAAVGKPAIAITRHAWMQIDILPPRHPGASTPRHLAGKRLFAVSAIGNPAPFLREAELAAGQPLAGQITLRDHDPYSPPTVERIISEAREARADFILTTDKDWSKLAAVAAERWPCPVAVPRLALAFDRGREALALAVLETVARGLDDGDTPDAEPAVTGGE